MGFSIDKRHLDKLEKLRFNPLDDELREALADVNLTLSSCKYYDEGQLNSLNSKFCKGNSKKLSLLSFNINGLPGKIDELESFRFGTEVS